MLLPARKVAHHSNFQPGSPVRAFADATHLGPNKPPAPQSHRLMAGPTMPDIVVSRRPVELYVSLRVHLCGCVH
jgi:hypothetical protein